MNDFTDAQRRALLAAYYRDSPAAVTPSELDTGVRMVRLLAFFWARVGAARVVDSEVYAELAARLGTTLQ
jgi:hypothetical protein